MDNHENNPLSLTGKEDSPESQEEVQQEEEVEIDLPEVEEPKGALAGNGPSDLGASSTDEEAGKVFEEEWGGKDNVSPEEKELLQRSAEETPGDEEAEARRALTLDTTDEEGENLNEGNLKADQWAQDMDFPELTSDETDYSADQT